MFTIACVFICWFDWSLAGLFGSLFLVFLVVPCYFLPYFCKHPGTLYIALSFPERHLVYLGVRLAIL